MDCFAPTEPPLGGVSVAFGTSLRLRSRTVSVVEVPSRSDALARFFALTGPTLLGLVAAARVGSSRWAGGSSCWAVDVVALARAGLAGSSTKPWSRPKSSSRFRNSEFRRWSRIQVCYSEPPLSARMATAALPYTDNCSPEQPPLACRWGTSALKLWQCTCVCALSSNMCYVHAVSPARHA